MIQGKVWGSTEAILVTPLIEVHRIKINEESYCSTHKHDFKYNGFYCLYGAMYIEVSKNDYDLVDTTFLKTNDFTTVKPGEYHRFVTKHSPAWALEIYYQSPLDINDIIRKNSGGILTEKQVSFADNVI